MYLVKCKEGQQNAQTGESRAYETREKVWISLEEIIVEEGGRGILGCWVREGTTDKWTSD